MDYWVLWFSNFTILANCIDSNIDMKEGK